MKRFGYPSLRHTTLLYLTDMVRKKSIIRIVALFGICSTAVCTEAQQGLQSQLFQGDATLNAAAVSDQAHITPGARGPHVQKIQTALVRLGAAIDTTELLERFYGPSTANAVLYFKQQRDIINRSFQTQADNIVGKMTIARLDSEMQEYEKPSPPSPLIVPPPPPQPPVNPNPPDPRPEWERGIWSPDKKFIGPGLAPPSIGCSRKWYCNPKTQMIIGGDERIEATPPEVIGGQCLAGTGPIKSCNECLTPPPQTQCVFRIIKK